MAKQFAAFHVSWKDARNRPVGLFADEATYGRAAAQALEARLNELAQEGWIVEKVIPAHGLTPRQTSAFTIVVFK